MARLKFYCLAVPCFGFLWEIPKHMVSRSGSMLFCNSHTVPKWQLCVAPASNEGVSVAPGLSAFAGMVELMSVLVSCLICISLKIDVCRQHPF